MSPPIPSVSSILLCEPIRCLCALHSLILVVSTGNKHQQNSSSSRQPQSCVKQSAMLSRVHPIYASATKFPKCSALTSSISIIFKFTRKANLRSHHKCLLSQKCWSWRLACTSLTNSPGDPAAHEGWRTRKPPKRKEGRTQIGGRCSWRQLADTGSWAQGPGHSSYNQELTRVGEGATPRRKRTESQ